MQKLSRYRTRMLPPAAGSVHLSIPETLEWLC